MFEQVSSAPRRAGAKIFVLACALLAACASVPDVQQKVEEAGGPRPAPQIVGARGPLTAQQSRTLLDRISAEAGDDGALKRHLAIEEAVAETPLVAGNRTRLLADGPETFPAMFAAIRSAKNHVNLEYYIFEDVVSDGERLSDLLLAKRQEEVAVNIIYDSFGSQTTPMAFFARLKAAGVNLVAFNPLNPLDPHSLNNRDHRKLLVVDGSKAIVGGINLSTTYQSSTPGSSGGPGKKPAESWRDTDLEIEGPVVAQLQAYFVAHWTEQKGPQLDAQGFFPVVPPMGTEVVRIIGSTPDKGTPRFYVTLLSAIRNAEKSVWVSAAYFVPTEDEKNDLIAAARRGVDVRLLLPGDSDSGLALAVGHAAYTDLLEAGVKVYETQNLVLHSKTAVIDGAWSVVGSSNFDQRSVLFNDEIDAVVLGSASAQDLEKMFERDFAKAAPVDLASWKRRPVTQRLGEVLSSFWQNLL
jgi:cardiolipin synthase